MNKTDFIKTVADKAQLTQKDTKAVYEAMVETIHEEMRRASRSKSRLASLSSLSLAQL